MELNNELNIKVKSGNLDVEYEIDQVLKDIKSMDLNTINIPVIISIENLESSNMEVDEHSKQKAINLIKKLKNTNINIILEPYPWIDDGKLYETEWMPSDIDEFFYNWKHKVLNVLINDICNNYDINVINIASNLVNIESYQDYWVEVVSFVRERYDGLVTYRTNWWYKDFDEKLNNKVFGEIDFISVAAYFELTNKKYATTSYIAESISSTTINDRNQNIELEIRQLYDKWKKPIFFGELGFPKRLGASMKPYDPYFTYIPSYLQQINCFKAYKRVFKDKDYILGFSVFAIGYKSYNKAYYPCFISKKIIKNWYK